MIENELQYKITLSQFKKLSAALAELDCNLDAEQQVHPILLKAQKNGLISQISNLFNEMVDYRQKIKSDMADSDCTAHPEPSAIEKEGDRNRKVIWCKYRFRTKSADVRPIIFNTAYPYWISGEDMEGSTTTIVAYLPSTESLGKYWDDAFDITSEHQEFVEFTDRFPKPLWYKP